MQRQLQLPQPLAQRALRTSIRTVQSTQGSLVNVSGHTLLHESSLVQLVSSAKTSIKRQCLTNKGIPMTQDADFKERHQLFSHKDLDTTPENQGCQCQHTHQETQAAMMPYERHRSPAALQVKCQLQILNQLMLAPDDNGLPLALEIPNSQNGLDSMSKSAFATCAVWSQESSKRNYDSCTCDGFMPVNQR